MKETFITSSILIAALLLLRLIFAKKVRRRLIYGAWLLLALRLLIPVQIGQLPFSLLNVMQPVTDAFAQIADLEVAGVTEQDAYRQVMQDYLKEDTSVFMPEIQDQIASDIAGGMSKEEIAERIDADYPEGDIYRPEAQPHVQQKVEEMASPVVLSQIATTVWLVGVAFMVIWLASSNLLLGRSLRKTEEKVECDSPIPVYVSEQAISPCLVGIFRPSVYLTPESAADDNLRHHVLTHELTHYAHKDHIWAWVRCICLCVYWFNPLVWVAAWFSRRDCELACDEGALKRLGEEERIAYGKALLQVVSQTTLPGRLMLTATTMAETKKQLRQRVNLIANRPKWSMIAAVSMVLVCVLIAGCVATGPVEIDSGDPQKPPLKRPWDVSEDVQLQLKQDYVKHMSFTNHSCTTEDVDLVVISQVDSGYAVVIGCKCGGIDVDVSWQDLFGESAADLVFYMPNGWSIQFCKDGAFSPLDGAYNLGWLSYEQLRTVWNDYHAQFPKALKLWQQVYGQSEPPARDSSGLDYQVNADGKTCTVTGMGVCVDAEVVIPEYIDGYQVTAIGELAFWSSHKVTSITMPDSVVSIGRSAFDACMQLESITLSNSLKTIGIHAFMRCESLKTIHLPNSLTDLGGGAFSGCSSLTAVTIPEGVIVIPAGLFRDCSNLESVTLHEGISAIGEQAFINCRSLTQLEIPDGVTKIEDYTFSGCVDLKEIRIPLGVTSIGYGAFWNCFSLEQMEIPDSVQTLGRSAFQDCTGLTGLSIGKAVWNLEDSVFENCHSLRDIRASEDNPEYRVSGGCLIHIQSGTLVIATRDAVIPKDGSVRHIGACAFQGQTDLQNVVLPEGIETIGRDAFTGCTNLAQIAIPASVRTISSAFDDCHELDTIIYSGTKAQWNAIRTGTYIGDGVGSFTVRCTDGELTVK